MAWDKIKPDLILDIEILNVVIDNVNVLTSLIEMRLLNQG